MEKYIFASKNSCKKLFDITFYFSHSNVPSANEYAGIVWNSFFIFEITNTIFKRSVLHQPLSVNKKELFNIFFRSNYLLQDMIVCGVVGCVVYCVVGCVVCCVVNCVVSCRSILFIRAQLDICYFALF